MRWLSKLLGRPGESREDEAARGHKVLQEEADAAGVPQDPPQQSQEPTTSEPIEPEPSDSFRPNPKEIVLAPARHNPVVKQPAEVVELHWVGSEEWADVREPGTEAEPWSVHVESLDALPD